MNSSRLAPIQAALLLALAGACVTLTACPTFEDQYTGVYREVVEECTGATRCQQRNLEVHFFRYGDFAQAIVRYYPPGTTAGEETFEEEVTCVWTREGNFDEETRRFRLFIRPSVGETQKWLDGRIEDDGTMVARISEPSEETTEETQAQDKRLELVTNTEPSEECDAIERHRVNLNFSVDKNVLPESHEERIEHPVFNVLWLGVVAVTKGSSTTFSGTQTFQPFPLGDGNISVGGRAMAGNLQVLVDPPPESHLMWSGGTRFLLGHLVVIDDNPSENADPNATFGWNVGEEPIVAAAIRDEERGVEVRHSGWGKALLFIEGDLRDIAPELKDVLRGLDTLIDQNRTKEHFYLGDVYYYNNTVVRFDLPTTTAPQVVDVPVTTDHMEKNLGELPRLFPN